MKVDGRTLSHEASETIRKMAVKRVLEGESPSAVMKSYGLCRTTNEEGIRSDAALQRTWGAKGETPIVQTSGATARRPRQPWRDVRDARRARGTRAACGSAIDEEDVGTDTLGACFQLRIVLFFPLADRYGSRS
jgi:hypothetical protein